MHDVISRSEVLWRLQELLNQEMIGPVFSDVGIGLDLAMDQVKGAPSLDAAPIVHAMWKGGFCTACGCETPRTRQIGDHAYRVPTMYCPDCGAKMDAKEDL